MSQHIVNVAFDFDDDKVRKTLEESAEKRIIQEIKEDVEKAIVYRDFNYANKTKESALRDLVGAAIDSFLEDYKDDIIRITSEQLVEHLKRTKAVKEMVQKISEEV